MTADPVTIDRESLATVALNIMEEKKIPFPGDQERGRQGGGDHPSP